MPHQSLSPEEIHRVAQLARLKLSPEESAAIGRDMSKILDYVALLSQVDTSSVQPLAHVGDRANVLRADDPAPSLSTNDALANAPLAERNCFSVPAILDES